jgi:DNA excision repair protein ERCC-5
MIDECKEILRLFGLPFITAASEAEAQCASLSDKGLVDAIITEDSDVLLFGDRVSVYKNVFNSKKYIEKYTMRALESGMTLTREKMILLSMFIGSDYTEGLLIIDNE